MVTDTQKSEFVISMVQAILDSRDKRDDKLAVVCRLLKDSIQYYDWVGFYIADRGNLELQALRTIFL